LFEICSQEKGTRSCDGQAKCRTMAKLGLLGGLAKSGEGSWGGRPRDAARWCIVCEMGMRSLDGGTALVCPKAFELLDVLLVNV
jgi:hypothetical protein